MTPASRSCSIARFGRVLSRADYEALEETAHLLRVPANAKRLIESLQQALSGQREQHDLVR